MMLSVPLTLMVGWEWGHLACKNPCSTNLIGSLLLLEDVRTRMQAWNQVHL